HSLPPRRSSDLCLAINQIALFIGGEGFDQCNVTVDWVFQHIVAAVDFSDLFALGQHGAVTGGGEECSDTSPCGTESFGQIALGDKLQFDFACPIGLIEVPGV